VDACVLYGDATGAQEAAAAAVGHWWADLLTAPPLNLPLLRRGDLTDRPNAHVPAVAALLQLAGDSEELLVARSPPAVQPHARAALRIAALLPLLLLRSSFNLPLALRLARCYGLPPSAALRPFIQLLVLLPPPVDSAASSGASGSSGVSGSGDYQSRVLQAAIDLQDDDAVAETLAACIPRWVTEENRGA
jgi:hypothetical protein